MGAVITVQTGRVLSEDLLIDLAELPTSTARDSFSRFIGARGDSALRRQGGLEHVTASCFVFSTTYEEVLLCFHRKGKFWVQFGGHIEPVDTSVADAAIREAREESGISDLILLSDSIAGLDRHDLHGGFSCATHWDVRFVATALRHARLLASDESEDVQWFPLSALPENVPPGFADQLQKVLASLPSLGRTER